MKKYIYVSAILCAGLMASCSTTDYYNTQEGGAYREYYVQKIKADYDAAFKAAFGEIDSNQSWDFSIAGKKKGVRAAEDEGIQNSDYVFVVEGDKSKVTESVELPGSPVQACDKYFKNKYGKDNSIYGSPKYTIISKGEVIIAPAWHGYCTDDYIFVVEGTNPQTGLITRYTFTTSEIKGLLGYGEWGANTKPIGAAGGQKKPKGWVFPFPNGTLVNFYLMRGEEKGTTIKVNENEDLYDENVLHATSSDPYYTDVFLLDDPDNNKDFDDLIVFIATRKGVEAPEVTEDLTQIITGPSKRYMVEDLGASQSSDIDFNDVVVDFYQLTKKIEHRVNGLTTSFETEDIQTAVIRALGGTKNIHLYVGDECIYSKSGHNAYSITDMLNTSENTNYDSETNAIETIDLSTKNGTPWCPWNADSNNIKIVVDDNNADAGSGQVQKPDPSVSWSITWAEPGTVPSVIAVDPVQNWNYERISVFDTGSSLNLLQLTRK